MERNILNTVIIGDPKRGDITLGRLTWEAENFEGPTLVFCPHGGWLAEAGREDMRLALHNPSDEERAMLSERLEADEAYVNARQILLKTLSMYEAAVERVRCDIERERIIEWRYI